MDRVGYFYRPKVDVLIGAVLVLHGSNCVASTMFDLGFEAQADTQGFLVVYPEMRVLESDEWDYRDDIPYFAELAKRLQEPDFGVPKDKVFICGHSAGGSMVTYLQHEMDEVFAAAGVVEAAVAQVESWTQTKRGKRTIVVWNHADPVLHEYAPNESEPEYYNLTVETLRRGSSALPDDVQALEFEEPVVIAERRIFHEDPQAAPELHIISWRTDPGHHDWALPSWTNSLDATQLLIDFFFDNPQKPDEHSQRCNIL